MTGLVSHSKLCTVWGGGRRPGSFGGRRVAVRLVFDIGAEPNADMLKKAVRVTGKLGFGRKKSKVQCAKPAESGMGYRGCMGRMGRRGPRSPIANRQQPSAKTRLSSNREGMSDKPQNRLWALGFGLWAEGVQRPKSISRRRWERWSETYINNDLAARYLTVSGLGCVQTG